MLWRSISELKAVLLLLNGALIFPLRENANKFLLVEWHEAALEDSRLRKPEELWSEINDCEGEHLKVKAINNSNDRRGPNRLLSVTGWRIFVSYGQNSQIGRAHV